MHTQAVTTTITAARPPRHAHTSEPMRRALADLLLGPAPFIASRNSYSAGARRATINKQTGDALRARGWAMQKLMPLELTAAGRREAERIVDAMQAKVSFDRTPHEARLIRKIVARATMLLGKYGERPNRDQQISMEMDIAACHANGNPLRLAALLDADEFNFSHDVFGIVRHIDRRSGTLDDMFSPRFTDREAQRALGQENS